MKLKIGFLTPSDAPDTLILAQDIDNNLTSKNGRRAPFTRAQRYVSLSCLEKEPKLHLNLFDTHPSTGETLDLGCGESRNSLMYNIPPQQCNNECNNQNKQTQAMTNTNQ